MRKGSIPVNLLILVLIGLMGFNNFGVFVSNHSIESKEFVEGQRVSIVAESEKEFTIEDEEGKYNIPKNHIIKNEKNHEDKYVVTERMILYGEESNQPIRWLDIGEVVEPIESEERSDLFMTSDRLKGSLDIENLEKYVEELSTPAVSKVDKVYKNEEGKELKVKIGDTLNVVDFEKGNYIVISESQDRFNVPRKELVLRGNPQQVTRGIKKQQEKQQKTVVNNAVDNVIKEAHKQLGKPYVSGDTGRRGFDCSGLTYAVYLNGANVKLPRDSRSQAKAGKPVAKSDLKPGDLVFFKTSGRHIGHVGLYIGNNNMIHASSGRRQMIVASINNSYFAPRYVTARRIID